VAAHDEGRTQAEQPIRRQAFGYKVEMVVDLDAPGAVSFLVRGGVLDDPLLDQRQEGNWMAPSTFRPVASIKTGKRRTARPRIRRAPPPGGRLAIP